MRTVRDYGLLLLLLISAFGAQWANAQSYPTKPIRVHTAVTGSGADIAARVIGPEISGPLGQPVVVENRNVGILAMGVAKAPPDGYTLLFWGGAFWLSPLLREAPYDPIRDFAPISMLLRAPSILVVHPSLPVKSTKDLIALIKKQPGKLNYASAATGTASHLAGELFKSLARVDFIVVKYSGGSAQSMADLLTGQTQLTIGPGAALAPQIKAGKVRALATTGLRRSNLFPDLPIVADALPGFVWDSLFGAFAPAKTPDAIVKRLNQEILRALDKPDVRDRLLKTGYEPDSSTPEELADSVKSEMTRVGKLIKEAGIKED